MWRAAISQAIAACNVFLVVLSPACIQSKNVVKELSLAETHDRPILPILYQPCKIPPDMDYQLAGIQYVDFTAVEYDQAFDRLLKALSARHGVDASTGPATAATPPQQAPPASSPPPHISPQPPPPQQTSPPLYQIVCGQLGYSDQCTLHGPNRPPWSGPFSEWGFCRAIDDGCLQQQYKRPMANHS